MRSFRRAALFVVIAAVFRLPVLGTGRAHTQAGTSSRFLVMIVVDGFRPDYMHLSAMPHLQSLIRSGTMYKRAWVGQLETETPTGHATIATGAYPRKHGVMGFVWRDPTGQNVSWMPTDMRQIGAGTMERLIEAGGVPTISDVMHQADHAAKVASISGEKYYAADAMGAGADYILYGKRSGDRMRTAVVGTHAPPPRTQVENTSPKDLAYPWVQDDFVARLGVRLLQTVRPRILLLNFPGADIEGHMTGGIVDPHDMLPVLHGVDSAIGTVLNAYRKAGLYNRTIFVVTSDHGMVPNRHVVPIKNMYAAVRATRVPDLEDDFLSTGGYVFLRDPRQAAMVANEVTARHFAGVEGALFKVSTPTGFKFVPDPVTARTLGHNLSSVYSDLANTLAAPSGPEVVIPYVEDAMGLSFPHAQHWGNHGGLSWRTQHIPLILSGPGISRGTSSFPAKLVDIAPTVERLMGLRVPRKVDGVVLSDSLQQPAPGDRAAQRMVNPQRSLDVITLLRHSQQQNGVTAQVGPG